jgi:hypothetical protein
LHRYASDVCGTVRHRMEQIEHMSPGTFKRYADKPASISRMLCSSERALDRIAFLKTAHPEITASEIATVNMPSAKFMDRYPDFDSWQRAHEAERREAERRVAAEAEAEVVDGEGSDAAGAMASAAAVVAAVAVGATAAGAAVDGRGGGTGGPGDPASGPAVR